MDVTGDISVKTRAAATKDSVCPLPSSPCLKGAEAQAFL